MAQPSPPGTLLDLPLIEERYGSSLAAAIAFHVLMVLFFIAVPYLLPTPTPLQIGSGPGGGRGGDLYTVGVSDEFSGGAGLIKPATTAQPPAPLPPEKAAKKEVKKEVKKDDPKAIALPDSAVRSRKKAAEPAAKGTQSAAAPAASNQIPDPDARGNGGAGGISGGSGGGLGGGIGISIGSGTGGVGDNWYARSVELRVGSNWTKPIGLQGRIEIAYSFIVHADGSITDIKLIKSSGNDTLDRTAERAILVSNPLVAPPPELRSRPLLFTAQFIYPPERP
jgi:TonB family protein